MERDRFKISELNQYYGSLLTGRQTEIVALHYDCDLSFGEIAEKFGISRQAVLDSLRRAENALSDFEKKLGSVAKNKLVSSLADDVKAALENDDTLAAKNKIDALKGVLEA